MRVSVFGIRNNGFSEPCGLGFVQLSALDDEMLMAHLQAGHEDALAVLFDRYHRLVLTVALKILRDLGEAEDVMQSVFLEILRVATQFDPARGTTKVWLLQYAYHRSMNRRQALAVRHFYDSAEISEIQELMVAPNGNLLSSCETKQLIEKAMASLNAVQRRVLQMAYFEGLSLQEIAEQTGESHGNIRNHYYRGIAKLRAAMIATDPGSTAILRREVADAGA